jgi:two-component system chemotaxis sensor kinase CheA
MREPELPPELVARFRSVAQARIERVESAWLGLVSGEASEDQALELRHELHTLKGEARAMGYRECSQLVHELEELLLLAQKRGWIVGEELDLVVVTALQFAAMLLKQKPGQVVSGIDLEGFTRQIRTLLAEDPVHVPERATASRPSSRRSTEAVEWLSPSSRQRLAAAAADVFVEHLAAEGESRARLLRAWEQIARLLGAIGAVPLGARLGRHAQAARELARDLGKRVAVDVDVGDLRVAPELADALDAVVLHGLGNAVDHGIESAEERSAAGKPAAGHVHVAAWRRAEQVVLVIEDDGRGVDLRRVADRAVMLGVLDADAAARASSDQLVELLFLPGFSTRSTAGQVSGRGVGMNAMRAVAERAGAALEVSSTAGHGLVLRVVAPEAGAGLPVRRVLIPVGAREPIEICLPAAWTGGGPTPHVLDLADALGLGPREPCGQLAATQRLCPPGGTFAVEALGLDEEALAERLWATPDDHPVEVVLCAGEPRLLVRPELLASAARVAATHRAGVAAGA